MDENTTERLNRSDRRSLMLISSAALQWVLILVCVVFLAVLYKGSQQVTQKPKAYVITELAMPFTAENCEKKIPLERNGGDLIVKNDSIVIHSSGFYLVHLEGMTNDNEKAGEITLHFQHTGNGPEQIWKEKVLNGSVRATLVKNLFTDSKVFLTTCSIALTFEQLHLTVHPV